MGKEFRLKPETIRTIQVIENSYISIEGVEEIKRLPLGLGIELDCGDDKRATLLLRIRLVSGVDVDQELMGVCVRLGYG